MEIKILHGQKVFFLDDLEWNEIFLKGKFLNFKFSNSYLKIIQDKSYFLSRKYEEIKVGLIIVGITEMSIPLDLLLIKEVYYRIIFENVKCPICSWKGLAGKYNKLDAYIGSPLSLQEKLKIIDGIDLPKKMCPNCKDFTFNDSIWLEY